ncbi:MAG: hypothetical protein GEU95_14195 [Rhizobiales bacterium]|nr:hypothetical protein [Hyphomicrobiales bacterium]
MLFPDDEAWRNKVIANAAVQEGLEKLNTGRLGQDQYEGLVLLALGAAPADDIARAWDERAERGMGAGMIVYKVCPRIVRDEAAPMQRTMREVGSAIWRRSASASKHVNTAVWKTYKPVAALWAAFIYLYEDGDTESVEFPCRPSELPAFLALAEAYRELAERTTPPRRNQAVLKPGDSIQLPESVISILPPGTLSIS